VTGVTPYHRTMTTSSTQVRPVRTEQWGRAVRGIAACAVVVAVVGAGGLLAIADPQRWASLDLDAEFTAPAALSALALAAAGVVLLVAASRTRSRAVGLVAALLLFMAVDEYLVLHERLESLTDVDWQKLYLPLYAVAGVAFLLVAYRHRRTLSFLVPWLAAAGLWAGAQVLERLEWRGDIQLDHYTAKMVTEELFELGGTGCFLVAGLVLLGMRALAAPGSADAAPGAADRAA
jgi:hypothetical protein